jgi:hypothetical protein
MELGIPRVAPVKTAEGERTKTFSVPIPSGREEWLEHEPGMSQIS